MPPQRGVAHEHARTGVHEGHEALLGVDRHEQAPGEEHRVGRDRADEPHEVQGEHHDAFHVRVDGEELRQREVDRHDDASHDEQAQRGELQPDFVYGRGAAVNEVADRDLPVGRGDHRTVEVPAERAAGWSVRAFDRYCHHDEHPRAGDRCDQAVQDRDQPVRERVVDDVTHHARGAEEPHQQTRAHEPDGRVDRRVADGGPGGPRARERRGSHLGRGTDDLGQVVGRPGRGRADERADHDRGHRHAEHDGGHGTDGGTERKNEGISHAISLDAC